MRSLRAFGWLIIGHLSLILSSSALIANTSPNPSVGQTGGTPPPAQCQTFIELPDDFPEYLPTGAKNGRDLDPGNSIMVHVFWIDLITPGFSTETRRIQVSIVPSDLKGSCLNKRIVDGSTFEDFTIEKAKNGKWDVDPHPAHYATDHGTSATTTDAIAEGKKVPLILTSYDFGGRCVLTATAVGCEPTQERIPLDTDTDTLPDAWERGKQFFIPSTINPSESIVLEYDIASPSSSGLGDPDGASDRDGGYEAVATKPGARLQPIPAKIHTEDGDGFSAFEEYRGIFVFGKHKRFEDLSNDSGLEIEPTNRATLIRDVFVFDANKLVDRGNPFIISHGQSYHKIFENEMTTETVTGPPPRGLRLISGKVDPNGDNSQRALWIVNDVSQAIPDAPGDSDGLKVNNPQDANPIIVNMNIIRDESTHFSGPNNERHTTNQFRDWVVAHETAHKQGLKHPTTALGAGVASAGAYTEANYWVLAGFPPTIEFWLVIEQLTRTGGGAPVPVKRILSVPELPNPPAFGNEKFIGAVMTTTIHGMEHSAQVFAGDTGAGFPAMFTLNRHTGSLMDITHEHVNLQRRIPPEERAKIQLKP